MEISKGIEIQSISIFIKEPKILVFGDLHIGMEEAMRKSGVHIPTNQFQEIFSEIKKVLDNTRPETIVINGDLKHHFGTISNEEWDMTIKLLKMIREYGDVKIIKGNHDTIIKPIADKLGIPLMTHFISKDIYICHGDNIPDNLDFHSSKTIIIGHEHPAVRLRDGGRTETYKCFLKGKYLKKSLIVMPSVNPLSEGSDVLTEKLLSPFLTRSKIMNFHAYIIGDEIYDFGKLRNIQKM